LRIETSTPKIDVLTLATVSTVAWALSVFLHEFVGHALLAILMGLDVSVVSTTAVDVPTNQVAWDLWTSNQGKVLLAGGTAMNIITGTTALLLLHYRKPVSRASQYFLWLFATFNFVIVTMYLVTATALGVGDWVGFVQGMESSKLITTLIIAVGVIFIIPGFALPLKVWLPDLKGMRLTLLKITFIPVLVLTTLQVLSVLNSPFSSQSGEPEHLFISLFVCIHLVLWAILVNLIPVPRSGKATESIDLQRSPIWIGVGITTFLLFIFVLGPGVGPFDGIG
jgi:hypothetical protein